MADKLRTQQQLEALQNKYIGTGHADTTRFEWTSNIARDSYASYVGHPPLLQYMTLAMGESNTEEMRVKLLEKMVRPVGPPPEVSLTSRDENAWNCGADAKADAGLNWCMTSI